MSTTTKTSSLPPPNKKVPYPIGEDPNGGEIYFYGNPNSSNIVIFCAGFPDDHENGQIFCSRLASEQESLVGLMCLPGFNDRPEKPWYTHKPEGYTFDEMAGSVRDAVKVLRKESTNESAKFTAIFHDWGSIIGMIWANRSLEDDNADSPDEIVLFDVLSHVLKNKNHKIGVPKFDKPSFYTLFVTFYYRIAFALAFALSRYVSKYVGLILFIIANTSMKIIPPLGPVYDLDTKIGDNRDVPLNPFHLLYMSYPYYYMIKGMMNIESIFLDTGLPVDLKKTPVLYLYGPEKRVPFHDKRSLYVLEREYKENRSKSNAIEVKNAGHWLYIQQTDVCLEEVKKFMSKKK